MYRIFDIGTSPQADSGAFSWSTPKIVTKIHADESPNSSVLSEFFGCAMDCGSNAFIRPAAAKVRDARVDLFVGRLRIGPEKANRRHDDSGLAIAALRDADLHPRLLHGVESILTGEALDRFDGARTHGPQGD